MGSIKDGLTSMLDFASAGTVSDAIDLLLGAIPNPDTTSSSGAKQGTDAADYLGYLDEMSPITAAQLRVELEAFVTAYGAGSVTENEVAFGSYTTVADDATANSITIDTGLTTADALSELVVSIERSGASVKADAAITDNEDGTFTIADGSTYAATAGDTVTWAAKV